MSRVRVGAGKGWVNIDGELGNSIDADVDTCPICDFVFSEKPGASRFNHTKKRTSRDEKFPSDFTLCAVIVEQRDMGRNGLVSLAATASLGVSSKLNALVADGNLEKFPTTVLCKGQYAYFINTTIRAIFANPSIVSISHLYASDPVFAADLDALVLLDESSIGDMEKSGLWSANAPIHSAVENILGKRIRMYRVLRESNAKLALNGFICPRGRR